MHTTSVVLADDDGRFRSIVRSLLESDGYEVVAEAGNASETVEADGPPRARRRRDRPRPGGRRRARAPCRSCSTSTPERPVIVISSLFDPAHRAGDGAAGRVVPGEGRRASRRSSTPSTRRSPSPTATLTRRASATIGAWTSTRCGRSTSAPGSTSVTSTPTRSCRCERWMDAVGGGRAQRAVDAVILATAGADGRPSARTVLLRGFDATRAARCSRATRAARARTSPPTRTARCCSAGCRCCARCTCAARWRRSRARRARRTSPTRPRGSQLAAWASHQSSVLADRAELEARFAEAERALRGRRRPVPAVLGRLPPGARRDRAVAGPRQPDARPAPLRARRRGRPTRLADRRLSPVSAAQRPAQPRRGERRRPAMRSCLVGDRLGVGEVAPHGHGARAGARRQLELHAAVARAGSPGWSGGRRAARSGSARGRRPPRSPGIARRAGGCRRGRRGRGGCPPRSSDGPHPLAGRSRGPRSRRRRGRGTRPAPGSRPGRSRPTGGASAARPAGAPRTATRRPARPPRRRSTSVPSSRLPPWKAIKPNDDRSSRSSSTPSCVEQLGEPAHVRAYRRARRPKVAVSTAASAEGEQQAEARRARRRSPSRRCRRDHPVTVSTAVEPSPPSPARTRRSYQP